jgi:hypothetical protein
MAKMIMKMISLLFQASNFHQEAEVNGNYIYTVTFSEYGVVLLGLLLLYHTFFPLPVSQPKLCHFYVLSLNSCFKISVIFGYQYVLLWFNEFTFTLYVCFSFMS